MRTSTVHVMMMGAEKAQTFHNAKPVYYDHRVEVIADTYPVGTSGPRVTTITGYPLARIAWVKEERIPEGEN